MGHLLQLVVVAAISAMITHANRITPASSSDDTMKPNKPGASVVEQTLKIIKTACVFDDDKLYMRRLAYVESYDGAKEGTFEEGYDGGIWKVDKHMFDELKTPSNRAALAKYTDQFRSKLGIDWERTTWADCRKARVSALASRLFNEIKLIKKTSITSDITKQAEFWAEKYRNNAVDKKIFEDAAKKLDKGCKGRGVDLAFVLDASGSVGSGNFKEMKKFVKDVVSQFDIAHNMTRVAVVRYESRVYTEFNLKSYKDKSSVLKHIDRIRYSGGGTATHLALAQLYKQIFTEDNGARGSLVPKFAIVLTDGQSNTRLTIEEANKVHKNGITMFAVGVGRAVMTELKAIASEPECLYLLMLEDFTKMDSLKDSIMDSACDAPVTIGPGQEGSKGSGSMKNGTDQNCKIKVPEEGATVKINAKTGGVTFYVSSKTYPSESYYDALMKAEPGVPGVMYVTKPQSSEGEGSVFCNIKSDDKEDTDFDHVTEPGDKDFCESSDCQNGATCVDDMKGSFSCACAAEYEGKQCGERIKYDCKTTSPCTDANVDAGRYYFPHIDEWRFVHCGNYQCYVDDCPAGTIFDPAFDVLTCVHKS